MKIIIKAKPSSKQEKVERVGQEGLFGINNKEMAVYKVWVKEPAVGGKANEAIRLALANYFDIPKSNVRIVSGELSKQKIFEIVDEHAR